jgi:glycosyltransferase involved in cell wall biosynthesis
MTYEKNKGNTPIGPVAVVIPVYNHEEKVADVVREALKLHLPLFVVDDGSTDQSFARIQDIPDVHVIRHDRNRGKGAALLTGFAAASLWADWAVTIDADGQHHPEDAWNLIRAVPPCTRPIVIGRREGMEHDHVPWTSRFGRAFSNFWVWASGGPVIEDSQSGFRLYPLPEVMCLQVQARRFQFEVEVLARAKWRGVPILSAPVRVTYQPVGERVSHYRGFVDFMRNTSTFSRLIFRRICVMPFIKGSQRPH